MCDGFVLYSLTILMKPCPVTRNARFLEEEVLESIRFTMPGVSLHWYVDTTYIIIESFQTAKKIQLKNTNT